MKIMTALTALCFSLLASADSPALKVPYACSVIFDQTPPEVKSINVTQRSDSEPIKASYDFASDNLSGIARVSLLVRTLPTGSWTDTGVGSDQDSDLLSYRPGPEMKGKNLAFATQVLDKAGNLSTILDDRPTGWFNFPAQDNSLSVTIKAPFKRQLSEYLWNGPSSDQLITVVGLGGPHGWGISSTDIVYFYGLPVIGLPTALDRQNSFRGTPFVAFGNSQVAYCNLGPSNNPIWDFWFGGNNHLISDDGFGNSVIDFNLDDYQALPRPQADFSWDATNGLKLKINPHSRHLNFAFFGLDDPSQIKSVGVVHYYTSGGAPWSYLEQISFEDWPTTLPLTRFRQSTVRVALVATTTSGSVCYANIDMWQCTLNGKPLSTTDNAWQFTLP